IASYFVRKCELEHYQSPIYRSSQVATLHDLQDIINTKLLWWVLLQRTIRRGSGTTIAALPKLRRKWRDRLVEVRLGVAVIQRQLLHSSGGEVVSFNCRYSV
ncbi:hypothetical protein HAX54_024258, partial [Datura stramonium]|nr:hypothetical protein [Datura stramonium]